MSKEMKFFIYLIDHYAEYKNREVADVLDDWDKHNLTEFIYDMYELYHVERLENAYMDIDSLMERGVPAW